MDTFTEGSLRSLATARRDCCVSLLLPTRGGGAPEDATGWKTLLADAADGLAACGVPESTARALLRPARAVLPDRDFWKALGRGGLAFFLAEGICRSFYLPEPVAQVAVVGPRFYLKTLLPLTGTGGRYYLLTISQNHVRLIRGTARGAEEVTPAGVPASQEEALWSHDRDEPLEFHTHPALGFGRRGAIFHGQGVGVDDAKDDLHSYFRKVDRGLHAVLRDERAPLVLAGVKYLWPIYRAANTYPHLLAEGVAGNPDRLSVARLHQRALPLVTPLLAAPREAAAALYACLAGTGRTANDPAEVVTAGEQGRVETCSWLPTRSGGGESGRAARR
jgi:hypothetical protein